MVSFAVLCVGICHLQVRSKEMHQRAEFGLAAHWSYKGGQSVSHSLDWITTDSNTVSTDPKVSLKHSRDAYPKGWTVQMELRVLVRSVCSHGSLMRGHIPPDGDGKYANCTNMVPCFGCILYHVVFRQWKQHTCVEE